MRKGVVWEKSFLVFVDGSWLLVISINFFIKIYTKSKTYKQFNLQTNFNRDCFERLIKYHSGDIREIILNKSKYQV